MEGEALGGSTIVTELVVRAREEVTEVMAQVIETLEVATAHATTLEARMGAVRNAMGLVSGAFAAATVGLVAWATASASAYQTALSHLQTFAGASASQMQIYKDGLVSVAAETGRSMTELADNLELVLTAGYHGAAALQVLTVASKGATAANVTVQETLRPLTQIMREFGVGADGATLVMDRMLVTARNMGGSPSSAFAQMNMIMGRTGDIAKQMGMGYLSVMQAADALMVVHGGMRQGITQTMALFQGLSTATEGNRKGLQDLGITTETWQKTLHQGIVPALELVQASLIHAHAGNELQKKDLQDLLGSTQAVRAYFTLQENGFAGIIKAQHDLANASGTTAQSFTEAESTMSVATEHFKNTLGNLANVVGTGFLPSLTKVTETFTALLTPLVELAYRHQTFTTVVISSVGAVSALAAAITGVSDVVHPFMDLFENTTSLLSRMRTNTEEMRDALTGETAAERMAATARAENAAATAKLSVEERNRIAALQNVLGVTKEDVEVMEEEMAARQRLEGTLASMEPAQRAVNQAKLEGMTVTQRAAAMETVDATMTQLDTAAVGENVVARRGLLIGMVNMIGSLGESIARWAGETAVMIGHGAQTVGQAVKELALAAATRVRGAASGAAAAQTDQLALATIALGGATDEATVSALTFDTVLASTGIGLLVIAVSLLIVGFIELVTHWSVVTDAARNFADALSLKVEAAIYLVRDTINDLNSILTTTQERIQVLNERFPAFRDNLNRLLQPITSTVTAIHQLGDALGWVGDNVLGRFGNAADRYVEMHHRMEEAARRAAAAQKQSGADFDQSFSEMGTVVARRNREIIASYDLMATQGITDLRKLSTAMELASAKEYTMKVGVQQDKLTNELSTFPTDLRGVMQGVLDNYTTDEKQILTDHRAKLDALGQAHNQVLANIQAKESHDLQEHAAMGPNQIRALKDQADQQRVQANQAFLGQIAQEKGAYQDHIKGIRDSMKGLVSNPAALFTALKQEADKLAQDSLSRLALAMVRGSGNIERLTEAAGKAQVMAEKFAAAENRAAIAADKASGNYGDAVQRQTQVFQTAVDNWRGKLVLDANASAATRAHDTEMIRQSTARLNEWTGRVDAAGKIGKAAGDSLGQMKDAATQTKDALTLLTTAMVSGHGDLGKLTDAAIRAQEKTDAYAAAETRAQIKVDLATGHFKDALDKTTQTLQTGLDNAIAKEIFDRLHHSGNIQADTASVERHQRSLNVYTAIQDRVNTQAEKVAKGFEAFQQAADTHATKAVDRLALAFESGHGNVAKLSEAVVRAEAHAQRFADALQRAQQVADRHDPTKAMGDQQGNLQTTLDRAINTYASHLEHHTGSLRADEAAITRAQHAMDGFTANVDKAKNFATSQTRPTDFSGMMQQASGRVSQAMDNLQFAMAHHKGNLDDLTAKVAAATRARDALTKIEEQAAIRVAKATGDWTAVFQADSQRLATNATKTFDHLTEAIYRGTGHLDSLTEKAAKAAEAAKKFQDAQEAASLRIAKASGDWQTVMSIVSRRTQDEMAKAMDHLTYDLLHHSGNIAKDTAAVERAALAAEKLAVAGREAADIQRDAAIRAALKVGDLATAAQLTGQKIQERMGRAVDSLTEAIFKGLPTGALKTELDKAALAAEKWSLAQQQAAQLQAEAALRAALKMGDLATAATITKQMLDDNLNKAVLRLTERLYQGADPRGLTDELQAAADAQMRYTMAEKQAADLLTTAEINAAQKIGDYADAFTLGQQQISQRYQDALNALADKIMNGLPVTSDDVDQVVALQEAQKTYTQAIWDATFATADAATQAKMLSDRFSHLVSEANQERQIQAGVDQAAQGIVTANNALVIDAIKGTTQAITNQTELLRAQNEVSKAIGAGQVQEIQDQTSIIQAQGAVEQATTAAARQVALDQLQEARIKDAADRAAAAWQIRLAQDNVRVAQAKMASDAMNQSYAIQIDRDHLKQAQDDYTLALDNAQLAELQLSVLNDIDSNLGAVNDYGDNITALLDQIGKDNDVHNSDILQANQDQLAQAMAAARAEQEAAALQNQIAGDQAASDSSANSWAVQAALAAQRTAQDQLAANKTTANNTTTQVSLMQQQLNAAMQELAIMNKNTFMGRLGLSRWQVTPGNERTWLNTLGTSNYANNTATL